MYAGICVFMFVCMYVGTGWVGIGMIGRIVPESNRGKDG